ncbi:MAG: tail fiber domain-containing protein [Sphingobacteriales bacterium]|nr:tail fiber domain-containing protein [Sphingobacteriales bacterium]
MGSSAYPVSGSVINYTGIGYLVGTSASASNMVEIGNTSVSVIRGQVGFTTYSDARIKENIQPDVPGLAFISQLKPVTYNLNVRRQNQMMYGTAKPDTTDWEGKYDIEKIRMTGFLAQDVEKAAQNAGFDFSGIVKPQNEHDLYSLRYAEFVVPLVKAVQEQQAIIETQGKTIEVLQAKANEVETLKAENQQIKAKLAQIEQLLLNTK